MPLTILLNEFLRRLIFSRSPVISGYKRLTNPLSNNCNIVSSSGFSNVNVSNGKFMRVNLPNLIFPET